MYLKGILGGIGGAIVLSVAYLAWTIYQLRASIRAAGGRGLGAVAGGVSLLRDPVLVVLALVGFWLGFYLMAR